MTAITTAGVVLIGNELLTGKIRDENGTYLIEQMRRRGIDLAEMHMVSDDLDAIVEVVNLVRGRRDICITSGGIGPTHDDVTMDAIAAAFSMKLERRPELVEMIEMVFGSDETGRAWQKMADVPTGTVMIPVETGWPVYSVENVYALPGIPQIFRRQVDKLLESVGGERVRTNMVFFKIGEGELAGPLTELAADFDTIVDVGSYPVLGDNDYQVKVTLDSRDPDALESATRWLMAAFPAECIHESAINGKRSAG